MTDGSALPDAAGTIASDVKNGVPDQINAVAARTTTERGVIGRSPFLSEGCLSDGV
jgi:hypothetical protein